MNYFNSTSMFIWYNVSLQLRNKTGYTEHRVQTHITVFTDFQYTSKVLYCALY